jgi:hypothetical protein
MHRLDDQCLRIIQGGGSQVFARVLHAGGPFKPWVKAFGSLDHTDFKCMAQEQGKCVSSPVD